MSQKEYYNVKEAWDTANNGVNCTLIIYCYFNVMTFVVQISLFTIMNSAPMLVMLQNEIHAPRHMTQCVETQCLCKYKNHTWREEGNT